MANKSIFWLNYIPVILSNIALRGFWNCKTEETKSFQVVIANVGRLGTHTFSVTVKMQTSVNKSINISAVTQTLENLSKIYFLQFGN